MAQPASKVDETDTTEYLNENPAARTCRARGHRWPEPETGKWEFLPDAAKGEPNAYLEQECERGCGTVRRRWGLVNLRKQTAELQDKKSMSYDEDYLLQGGARITRKQAEEAIMLEQLTPVRSAKAPAPKPAAQKPGKRRLHAVAS